MNNKTLEMIKDHVYVYWCEAVGTMGIYIAESKEDAIESINSDFWDNHDWSIYDSSERRFISREEKVEWLVGHLGEQKRELAERMAEYNINRINIRDAIEVYSWDEYQAMQKGLQLSDRMLEMGLV